MKYNIIVPQSFRGAQGVPPLRRKSTAFRPAENVRRRYAPYQSKKTVTRPRDGFSLYFFPLAHIEERKRMQIRIEG